MEHRDGSVVAENAAEVLAAIARARTPPLTYVLGSPQNVQRLISLCVNPETKTQLLVQVKPQRKVSTLAFICISDLCGLRGMCWRQNLRVPPLSGRGLAVE